MRTSLFTILLTAAFTLIFGCSGDESRAQLSKEERERQRLEDSAALKIGVTPTEDCLPIVVAKELRLFDTLGVDVHLRCYKAMSECRHALVKGLVEGAAIDTTLMALINAESREQATMQKAEGKAKGAESLFCGMKTSLSWQFLTAKKARISRFGQLSDKIIATDSHGESHRLAEQVTDSLVKKGSMVFIVQVEDPKVRLNMLLSGNIDAALLPEPFATKARQQGANAIALPMPRQQAAAGAGVVAFRTKAMEHPDRKQQQKLFVKAVGIAKDSIAKYGKDRYTQLLAW